MLTVPQELKTVVYKPNEETRKLVQNTEEGIFTGTITKIEDVRGSARRKYIEIKVVGKDDNFMHYFDMSESSQYYLAHLWRELAEATGLFVPEKLEGNDVPRFLSTIINKEVQFEQKKNADGYLDIKFLPKE